MEAAVGNRPLHPGCAYHRLVGPLTLWDASKPEAAWIDWETVLTPALLEGLAPIQVVAYPTGVVPEWTRPVPGEVPAGSRRGNAA